MKLYTMFRSLLYHKYVREFQVQDVLYLHSIGRIGVCVCVSVCACGVCVFCVSLNEETGQTEVKAQIATEIDSLPLLTPTP